MKFPLVFNILDSFKLVCMSRHRILPLSIKPIGNNYAKCCVENSTVYFSKFQLSCITTLAGLQSNSISMNSHCSQCKIVQYSVHVVLVATACTNGTLNHSYPMGSVGSLLSPEEVSCDKDHTAQSTK